MVLISLAASAQDTIKTRSFNDFPPEQLRTDEFGAKYFYDEIQQAKIYQINGESVVVLDELVMRQKPRFNNQLDQNYYYFLNKKLTRVYPLFLAALQQYRDLVAEMAAMDTAEKRRYTKEKQDRLAAEYESKLRDLTTTEGRIFAKLMYRATGKTVFDIIKELRGGWSAFWWNVKGNMADIELKQPYDPHANRTDEFVESLLQSNWDAGYLIPYTGYQEFKVKR